MKVGIDGACWDNQRGYGRFLRELLTALGEAGAGHQYIVYLDPPSYAAFDLQGPFEPRLVGTRQSVAEAATAEGARSPLDLLKMSMAVSDPLDLFFFPSVFSYFPLLRRVPMLLGIHDTIADRNPQFSFQSRQQEWLWRAKVKLAIAQSTRILTVSQYSRRSIADWFHLPLERISVIQEAASARFTRTCYPPPSTPFVLYVGGISPNKNLARLIQAFAITQARARGAQLVMVGDYQKDGFKSNYQELAQLVERLGLSGQAVFTGFVSDEELSRLYNTCTVFAMPSLDEGFGLPAIEAMSCGRVAVVSSGNSLEEVVADAGVVVDPESVDAIAAGIDRVFADPGLQASLGDRAVSRSLEFSWQTSAQQLLAVFEETVRAARR